MSNDTTAKQSEIKLQLEDLVRILEIVDLASTRGAFRPQEYTIIGGVYDRILAFLEASGAVQRPPKSEAQPEGNQQ